MSNVEKWIKLINVMVRNRKIVWGFGTLVVALAHFGAILPSQLNESFYKSGSLHGELVQHRADGGGSNVDMGFFLRKKCAEIRYLR